MRTSPERRILGDGQEILGVGPSIGAAPVVVAIHGRDQDAAWAAASFAEIAARSEFTWLFPEATAGWWWPLGFMADQGDNEPHLGQSLDAMRRLDDALLALGVRSVVWLGFSQGACLALEHVTRQASSAVGLIALTGAHVGPLGTELTVTAPIDGLPVLLSSGEFDSWLPHSRVSETARALRAAGVEVEVVSYADAEHVIRPDEFVGVANFLERVSPQCPKTGIDELPAQ